MRINYVCKQVTASDKLKSVIDRKISKLDKYFKNGATATVTLTKIKDTERLELTISASGTLFRSEVEGPSFYHAIDDAVNVIERQIRKNKTRLEKKMKESFVNYVEEETVDDSEFDEDVPEFVVREKKFQITPMSVEEAIMQMNLLEHSFFVFVDQETDEVSVVYARKDGTYGLINTTR